MNTPLIRRPDGNGASAEAVPAVPVLIALAAASLAAVALRRPARR